MATSPCWVAVWCRTMYFHCREATGGSSPSGRESKLATAPDEALRSACSCNRRAESDRSRTATLLYCGAGNVVGPFKAQPLIEKNISMPKRATNRCATSRRVFCTRASRKVSRVIDPACWLLPKLRTLMHLRAESQRHVTKTATLHRARYERCCHLATIKRRRITYSPGFRRVLTVAACCYAPCAATIAAGPWRRTF